MPVPVTSIVTGWPAVARTGETMTPASEGGRVASVTDATAGRSDYAYDANGNLFTVTGPTNNDSGIRPVSKEFAPAAVSSGALVIDNSSAYRMEEGVPLVVPEVNPEEIAKHRGIIANPNCSTIQMVVPLKPLHDRWKIKRLVIATYQSVTGAGKRALSQLESELAKEPNPERKFPHAIANNVLIIPGDVFSNRGSHVRISYAIPEERIRQGVEVLTSL